MPPRPRVRFAPVGVRRGVHSLNVAPMTGPWFFIPFGVALAAFGVVQLGSTPRWWEVATALILSAAGAVSVLRGILDLRSRRRGSRD